jgi:uncharacterized protein (DUF305 family)
MRRSLLALLAAVVLTACNQGGGEQVSAPATAAPNDADVTFAQNMIPHHQQAIEMAELVDTRTKRPSCAPSPTASPPARVGRSA